MSTGYQIYEQEATYFLTCTIVDWVDVFSRQVYRDIVIDSLDYCMKNKGLKLYGYVIMTNHIHLVVRSETHNLSDVIRDFKKYTARNILDKITTEPESRREWILHRFEWAAKQHERNSKYQVWTHENHAIQITSKQFFDQKLAYIHQNPVRAGWVLHEEDYIYSSARQLSASYNTPLQLSHWYD